MKSQLYEKEELIRQFKETDGDKFEASEQIVSLEQTLKETALECDSLR